MRDDLEYEQYEGHLNEEELDQLEMVRSYDIESEGNTLTWAANATQWEAWVDGKLVDTHRSSALRCYLERRVDAELHAVWVETTFDIASFKEAVEMLVYAAERNLDARIERSKT